MDDRTSSDKPPAKSACELAYVASVDAGSLWFCHTSQIAEARLPCERKPSPAWRSRLHAHLAIRLSHRGSDDRSHAQAIRNRVPFCSQAACLANTNGATPMNSRDQEHNGSTNQRGRARRVPRPAEKPETDSLGHASTDVIFDPLGNVTTFHYSMADFPQARRTSRRVDQTNAKRSQRLQHRRGSVQPTCDQEATVSACDERQRSPHLPVARTRRSRP